MSDIVAWMEEQIVADEVKYAARSPKEEHWAIFECGDLNEGYIVYLHERLRAECAAKRALLELHESMPDWGHGPYCGECTTEGIAGFVEYPCPTVAILASVYADRPGYDPAWSAE